MKTDFGLETSDAHSALKSALKRSWTPLFWSFIPEQICFLSTRRCKTGLVICKQFCTSCNFLGGFPQTSKPVLNWGSHQTLLQMLKRSPKDAAFLSCNYFLLFRKVLLSALGWALLDFFLLLPGRQTNSLPANCLILLLSWDGNPSAENPRGHTIPRGRTFALCIISGMWDFLFQP